MSVSNVKNKIIELTRDGVLDEQDLQAAAEAAGNKVNADEMNVLRDAVLSANNIGESDSFSGYNTTLEAFQAAQRLGVGFVVHGNEVQAPESLEKAMSIREASFGGTPVPQAVKDLLVKAHAAGMEPFDVLEATRNNATGEVKGVFSDYPSMSEPVENMAFDYTELTPQSLADDMQDPSEYNVIGTKRGLGPGGQSLTEIVYERRAGGTGNVMSHYDEGMHEDIYARGSQGQKWANNFAILSDGSVHALPAARRDKDGRMILTNPALARGKRVLYMGHLNIRGGVVQDVEMSGRLCRRAAEGDQVFVDPVGILEAWGFEMAPRIQQASAAGDGIRFSNTSDGTPYRDVENGVIRAPDTP